MLAVEELIRSEEDGGLCNLETYGQFQDMCPEAIKHDFLAFRLIEKSAPAKV